MTTTTATLADPPSTSPRPDMLGAGASLSVAAPSVPGMDLTETEQAILEFG